MNPIERYLEPPTLEEIVALDELDLQGIGYPVGPSEAIRAAIWMLDCSGLDAEPEDVGYAGLLIAMLAPEVQ